MTAAKTFVASREGVQRFLFDMERASDEKLDKLVDEAWKRTKEVYTIVSAARTCAAHGDKVSLLEQASGLATELGQFLGEVRGEMEEA